MPVMTSDKRRGFRETCSVFYNFLVFCSTNDFEINSEYFFNRGYFNQKRNQ